jgi:hypothetical protein
MMHICSIYIFTFHMGLAFVNESRVARHNAYVDATELYDFTSKQCVTDSVHEYA